MILCDSSAIIALINRHDQNHLRCVAALKHINSQLITTWACLTEAMYFLGVKAGVQGQEILRGYLEDGLITLHIGSNEEATRIYFLMRQYTYMDFADASLVAMAEVLDTYRVFTLDSHFYSYLANNKTPFEVLP